VLLGQFAVHKQVQTARTHPWAPVAARRAWRGEHRRSEMVKRGTIQLVSASNEHGELPHIPVMLPEVLCAVDIAAGQTIVDATFGAGGYTRAFLETGADVLAIDRDPNAIEAGQSLVDDAEGRLNLVHGRFSNLDALARAEGLSQVDAVVADIGVSSMQIDQAERGFSFQKDGPLDMRMEQAGVSAADVVKTLPRQDITRLIGLLGDERQASRISGAIERRREKAHFLTTLDLANCIEGVLSRKPGDKIHPATRTFQALRIFVNRELEELADALLASEQILKPGGRLCIVTFHSLEDRLVKRFLLDRAEQSGGSRHLPAGPQKELTFELSKRGAIKASDSEAKVNPRSRSAKMRFALRTEAPTGSDDRDVFGLPRLAKLETVRSLET